jgi:hypothetical protein
MGYYILFELDKLMVKKEMNAQLSATNTALVCLEIEGGDQNPSFHRLDSREIEFNGRLYDVYREVDKGSSKLIFCIPDTREEQLYSGLKKINHNKQRFNLWDHLVNIALPEGRMTLSTIFPVEMKFPGLTLTVSSSVLSPVSPPPKSC